MTKFNNIHCIIGDQRSGTTLYGEILAADLKVQNLGETALISNFLAETGHGINWDYRCTCGEKLNRCSFWSSKCVHVTESQVPIYVQTELLNDMDYVDSSKSPFYANELEKLGRIRSLHFVFRHPVSVAQSKKNRAGRNMIISHLAWVKKNIICLYHFKKSKVLNKRLVHFEEFAKHNQGLTYSASWSEHQIAGSPHRFDQVKSVNYSRSVHEINYINLLCYYLISFLLFQYLRYMFAKESRCH